MPRTAETTENVMTRQAGLWIDHREAHVVLTGGEAEVIKRIESDDDKAVRFSGGNRPEDGKTEDRRDRHIATHLNRYYDDVIACLRDAEAILIFGPGEAKGELAKRLASKGLDKRIVAIETVDKMTVPQIKAKVHQHFAK
jgi:stalled ribosome rescue protein Dom34